jgi:hypothetical protein
MSEWTPKPKDDPGERKTPVTYERYPEIGYGFIPVIDEDDPLPTEEHYAEAERLERQLQQALKDE